MVWLFFNIILVSIYQISTRRIAFYGIFGKLVLINGEHQMFKVHNEGIILEPTYDFEKNGVFNPACIVVGDEVWMYFRGVSAENVSTIGLSKYKDDELIKHFDEPIMKPEHNYESCGVEDPRISFVDGTYYMFYAAYDGTNAQIAYATTKKLPYFQKQGLLLPEITYEDAGKLWEKSNLSLRYEAFEKLYENSRGENVLLWEKDCFLFPEKINGKFALCHRVLPGIQIVYFNEFSDLTREFWLDHLRNLDKHVLLEPKYWYDSWNVGGGCPPIKTDAGWLLIYHAVESSSLGRTYYASAALLDLENPQKIIGRLKNPLISPTYSYEKKGVVDNVVFPTSVLEVNNRFYIYHGAGDQCIALKSVDKGDLIKDLKTIDTEPELSIIKESKKTLIDKPR